MYVKEITFPSVRMFQELEITDLSMEVEGSVRTPCSFSPTLAKGFTAFFWQP
jgi:hypothetical protein